MIHENEPATEPIAIVGIGLRYPGGATDVESFWELMANGVDAITEIPGDRWSVSKFYHPTPGAMGKSYSKWGGFIDRHDQFDARLFGISAGEAENMDPQQRWLLEAAWHALEDGGHPIDRAAGDDIGVFIGASTSDYGTIGKSIVDHSFTSPYAATGGAQSITANRISHALNLNGPSVAFDTACSSSLVALHYACASLRSGDCGKALVGGVNFILEPSTWNAFCGMTALSKDGRCKAFDASADGFVRSEGVGVVFIKPLSQAIASGDRIYACIRSTSSNQDGRTPAIAMPDQHAQEALIREALLRANLNASDISYVEAHGTGTAIGDPIEARAIGNVLGKATGRDSPLTMGSVKTNIGHLEAAAGLAGLIKTALVLRNRRIPANLHFNEGNPAIAFEELNLSIPSEASALISGKGSPAVFACVNSFGFGGANAHAILGSVEQEDGVSPDPSAGSASPPFPLLLISAQTEISLRSLVESYIALLEAQPDRFADICSRSVSGRSLLRHRVAVTGKVAEDVCAGLRDWLGDTPNKGVVEGQSLSPKPREVTFVFSGQGSQWYAMGRELYCDNPTFKGKIDQCRDLILKLDGFDLVEELMRDEEDSRVNKTEIAQPAIFAIQVALVDVWREYGVIPSAVVGHSVGEVAAAHVAGVLTLEQAVRVIFYRGNTMGAARGGKMIAVGISAEVALDAIKEYGDELSLAAINGPESVSISGDPEALEKVFLRFESQGVFCRYVPVDYAFHSAQMDPVEADLAVGLEGLKPSAPRLPIYSTVTGELVESVGFDAQYWWRNVRRTVRFAPAISQLITDGFSVFLEVGSHPVLKPSLQQCAAEKDVASATIAFSQHKKAPAAESLFENFATLVNSGCDVDLSKFAPPSSHHVELPRYPFDRERYWRESPLWANARTAPLNHPYLGTRTRDLGAAWHFWPDLKTFPCLRDHVVNGNIIFPGSGYVEMVLALARELMPDQNIVIEELEFKRAFPLSEEHAAPTVRIAADQSGSSVRIDSCSDSLYEHWQLHTEGGMRATSKPIPPDPTALASARAACTRPISPEACYEAFSSIGLDYGPAFQGIREIHSGENQAFAELRVELPEGENIESYLLHPALLDSACQTVLATLPIDDGDPEPAVYLPVWIDRLRFQIPGKGRAFVHTKLTSFTSEELEADLTLFTDEGEVIAQLQGFRCQRVRGIAAANADFTSYLETLWELTPLENTSHPTEPSGFFPTASVLTADLANQMDRYWEIIHGKDKSFTLEPQLNLIRAHLEAAFIKMGVSPEVGFQFTFDELVQSSGVIEQHHTLLKRFLAGLSESGVFEPTGEETWKVAVELRNDRAGEELRALLAAQPSSTTDLFLITLMSEHLIPALRGEENILSVYFDQQNSSLLERLYSDATSSRFTNEILVRAIRDISAKLPQGRMLRVLEIGAGTGASARHYLRALPQGSYEFTFTDVSEAFFVNAEKKFKDFPGTIFRKLDVSVSPSDQGFASDYDIVIAADVIHATPDLLTSLTHARQLLRPGGMLMMVEIPHRRHLAFDFLFGLTPGAWVGINDPLRQGALGLPKDEWCEALGSAGFSDLGVVDDCASGQEGFHAVFVAQVPNGAEARIEAPPIKRESREWVILAAEGEDGSSLAGRLESAGDRVTVINAEDWRVSPGALMGLMGGVEKPHGLILLGSMDASDASDELSTSTIEACAEFTIHQPVEIIQSLAGDGRYNFPGGVWLATRGALQVFPDELCNVTQSPMHGMGRVVFNEVREIAFRLIDLSVTPSEEEWELFAGELLSGGDKLDRKEDQVAFRDSGRYVPRCYATNPAPLEITREVGVHEQCCRITSSRFGSLDALCVETDQRRDPDANEVEVKIHAAGLNFRDVMKALKIYPTTIGDAKMLGDDFAGEVVAVGEGVTRFAVGDRICGVALGSFRSFWTGSADFLCHLPEAMSFEEGATILTVYNTAFHALHDLGRISKGERVLIHSAAGGVGYAAVRLAQLAGAEVFATAGTSTKREILRQLGVPHVYDSRKLEFADEIMATTNGEGIDIVLNALAGEAIPKSLGCLRLGGRFLEIGKRDIYENTKLGLRPFKNALSFSSIDLAYGMRSGGSATQTERIEKSLANGDLPSLPYSHFPFGDPTSAFRFMSMGKHLGKIIFTLSEQKAHTVTPLVNAPVEFDGNQTALITGGTRGLGLQLAQWYLDRGVGCLLLLARSGADPENLELHQFMDLAKERGVRVEVRAVDVSDQDAMTGVIAEAESSMPPIGAVVHGAFVLADELFLRMTRDQFDVGMQAKVSGAWNLHRLTRNLPVQEFIVLSSIASVVGNPGQANYVAANVFLEELVKRRRADGLAGTAIHLDMINDTGFVARNEEVGNYLRRSGWRGITGHAAIGGIGKVLANAAVSKAVHGSTFLKSTVMRAVLGETSRYQAVLAEAEADSDGSGQQIKAEILNAAPEDRVGLMEAFLRDQVGRILRVPPKSISLSVPLSEQGVDSLMAVEFVTLLESKLSISVPTTNMMNAPTVSSLSALMVELLTGEKVASAATPATAPSGTDSFPGFADDQKATDDLSALSAWLDRQELTFAKPSSNQRVLLTGANGFLGVYELIELLQGSDVTVTCFVRAKNPAEGERRLREAVDRYQLDWAVLENSRDRWSVVPADLEQPRFGLGAGKYEELAGSIDVILHGAAKVSHVAGYAALRQVNVLGTLEIIRFAGVGTPKAIHFASSVAVYSSSAGIKSEDGSPDPLDEVLEGYGQSKSVCEGLLKHAESMGLPLVVHRIAPVVGDDRSGISAHHDFVWLLLKACLILGAAPRNDWNLSLTPVDFAARLLVESFKRSAPGTTMNFLNPERVTLNDLIDAARRRGFDVESLSISEWAVRIANAGSITEFAPYLMFRKDLHKQLTSADGFAEIEFGKLGDLMEASGVKSVPMDHARVDRFIDFLIKSEFLPEPQRASP